MNRLEKIYLAFWLWGVVSAAMVAFLGTSVLAIAFVSGFIGLYKTQMARVTHRDHPLIKQ